MYPDLDSSYSVLALLDTPSISINPVITPRAVPFGNLVSTGHLIQFVPMKTRSKNFIFVAISTPNFDIRNLDKSKFYKDF